MKAILNENLFLIDKGYIVLSDKEGINTIYSYKGRDIIAASFYINGDILFFDVDDCSILAKELNKKRGNKALDEDSTLFEEFKMGVRMCYDEIRKIYKFSDNDLREAIAESWNSCEDNEDEETFYQVMNRILSTLEPKEKIFKEIQFEVESDTIHKGGAKGVFGSGFKLPNPKKGQLKIYGLNEIKPIKIIRI